jgi:hypothetical protein
MIHGWHEDLPERQIRTYAQRWGSLRSDPTSTRSRSTLDKITVIATFKGERKYVGKAHSKEQADEMLTKYYDEHCEDHMTCGHYVHRRRREGQEAC